MSIANESKRPEWAAIRRARQVLIQQKMDAEAEVRQLVDERLAEAEAVLSEAIIAGVAAGLSKAAIGRAYGSKDYRTIESYIDRAENRRTILDKLSEIDADSPWVIVREMEHASGYLVRNGSDELEFEIDGDRRRVFDPSSNRYVEQPEGTDWIFERWMRDSQNNA